MKNANRVKRSAAIFLATYVTGVETSRERSRYGKRAQSGRKKSRLRISGHRDDDQPDGSEPDYSRGIFQLSKPLLGISFSMPLRSIFSFTCTAQRPRFRRANVSTDWNTLERTESRETDGTDLLNLRQTAQS